MYIYICMHILTTCIYIYIYACILRVYLLISIFVYFSCLLFALLFKFFVGCVQLCYNTQIKKASSVVHIVYLIGFAAASSAACLMFRCLCIFIFHERLALRDFLLYPLRSYYLCCSLYFFLSDFCFDALLVLLHLTLK